ncbi:MAG: bifunctional hydroxymethylpyrimidine kinase/phosphomethylpyrimidine kinase, partial [Verrucomicrobiota bacterium]
ESISAAMVCAQMDVLLRHFPVAAIKTGLLCSREIVMVVAKSLRARSRPLVVDPVMVATSGDPLLRDDAIESYEKDLFPLAALITPNLDEASRLFGESIADLEGMRTAGVALQKKYDVPILLKGGHLTGAEAIDLLFVKGNVIQFSAPFARGLDTHGTGCTYSAAITAGLANGQPLEEAVRRAKKFVTSAITEHLHWTSAQTRLHALNHSPSNF